MASIALFSRDTQEEQYQTTALTAAGHTVTRYPYALDSQHLPEVRDVDAISVFVSSHVTHDVIDAFPHLKLITTRSTGFDHIDVAYARSKGIAVGYVSHYGENTVAEFAMGLMLTLSRKLFTAADRIKETNQFSYDGLEGFDLKGKTLGVIGAGHIGQCLIAIAKGFGMQVIAYDRFPRPELASQVGFSYKTFDEVLAQSDVISLHLFYAPETHHIINADAIMKMKKGIYIINTARGALIDTEALVAGLKNNTIAGAALDVIEEENIAQNEAAYVMHPDAAVHDLRAMLANHVLMDMPNVIVTPHMAFNTKEARQRILDGDSANITSFFASGSLQDPVPSVA